MDVTNDYGIVFRLTSRWETDVMTCDDLSWLKHQSILYAIFTL